MTWEVLVPAELAFDGNGVPYSTAYGDVYHSTSGGLEQARQVFLAGNDLPRRWQGRDFAILETGFGLGLNFLATWQAWLKTPGQRLHYVAIERHPFRLTDLVRLHERYAELAPLAARLQAAWPSLIPGFHRLHFDEVTLTLVFGSVERVLGDIAGRFDAFYLDGFSPTKNPQMWSAAVCDHLAWLAAPQATLATWCVAGEVRRNLSAAGFRIERRPGFGAKREMLVGEFTAQAESAVPPAPSFGDKHIAVIGAGIAGLACAERLAARGCSVTLFERREGIARETSGNHQAVLLPALATDATRLSRLNQVAFLYAVRQLEAMASLGHPVASSLCGVFQIARDDAHARKQAAIVEEQRLPDDFVRFLDIETASERVGVRVAGPGWWFPRAGWVSPASFAAALLEQAGSHLDLRLATEIAAIEPCDAGWRLLDTNAHPLWEGAAVILANAHGITHLAQASHLPILCFRGQASHLPASELPIVPRCVVCREGYLAPPHRGIASLGASFKRSHELAPSLDEHAANLARLYAMLPEWTGRFSADQLDGRVGLRPVSPDKLPLVGALPLASCAPRPLAHVEWPRWPGLLVATGYGARGFVWAPLMGELLASKLCGEPLPIGHELDAAIDPARFVWRGKM